MTLKNGEDLAPRALLGRGVPIHEFRFSSTSFRLSTEEPGDDEEGRELPAMRDDVWQAMLRMALGCVPKGAEHAPPCNCELHPIAEKYDFSGLAGLPPSVRLMDGFFPVRDQSKRGACFAFALVALCEYMLGKRVELSEQSLFHFTKLVTPGKVERLKDGAFTLDAIHAIEEYGICPLSEWHYNPESWNYVEDPENLGQGLALQKKLAAAQKYRFHNWRMLSEGSVLQFKQTLSAGFPVYTGLSVTTDWDDGNVRETGVIPYPKLFWRVRVAPPPIGLVLNILAENEVEPDEETVGRCSKKLMAGTLDYLSEAVFQAPLTIIESDEEDDGLDLVVHLDKLKGTGHAMCLVGYADDKSYSGGGYFIARNSWSDTRWGSKSPEKPGYALIPYAYIADYGNEGVAMSEFPKIADGTQTVAATDEARLAWHGAFSQHSAPRADTTGATSPPVAFRADSPPAPVAVAAPAAKAPFDRWLAERLGTATCKRRDKTGYLLEVGTVIIFLDPEHDKNAILRDTPENRERMRSVFEKDGKWHADEERKAHERLLESIKRIVDESLDRLVPPDALSIRQTLMEREPGLDIPSMEGIGDAMKELCGKYPRSYTLERSFYGQYDEIQKVCKG